MKRHLHIVAIAAIVGAIAAGGVQSLFSAYADQSERVPPTAGIFTGIQYSQKLGDAFRSVSTGNKGSTAPANVGGTTVDGLEWLDDTTSTWAKKRWVNGGWAVEGAYSATDSTWVGVIGGGAPASIASGATVDLGSVPQANVTITGTTTITGFGSAAPSGVIKVIRFNNALTLTHSSSLTVPGGYNLTTAANDRGIVTHLGSGNWEVTQYTRASGIPVDVAAVGKTEMQFSIDTPDSNLFAIGAGQAIARTSYPAYFAKVTRAQNGTRTSGNATITGIANTAGFGAGMPVESTGVNASCTIASFVANTSITLNSAGCVTSSGTSTVRVFPTGYGSAGSSTTVGVPDCRGRSIVGIDSGASRLSTTYFGAVSGANPAAMAAPGGAESQTLLLTQLPGGITAAGTLTGNNAISVSSAPSGLTFPANQIMISMIPSGGSQAYPAGGSAGNNVTSSGTNNISVSGTVTSNNTGGGAHPIMSPAITANCFVRVVP